MGQKGRLMTSNPSCVKALLLVVLSAAAADAQTHTLVSVGDHRLDVVRAGAGGPAVVFETGLADSLDVWLPMLRTISEYTTVVAYSRAGFGRSDAGPPDHSVPHAARDLHELLHRLPIKPPYILVARSYGSLISRLRRARAGRHGDPLRARPGACAVDKAFAPITYSALRV
jgi:alpha/beta hydrolase fold